jgi:hypothetical protein
MGRSVDGLTVRNMKLILIVARRSHQPAWSHLSDLLLLTIVGGDEDVAFKQQLQ